MDRKKQILNAIKNRKLEEFEFDANDSGFLLEIIEENLKKENLDSCVYIRKIFIYRYSGLNDIQISSFPGELNNERKERKKELTKRKKRKQIMKAIRAKIDNKISNKLIHLIETNKIELFHDFFQELYQPEEDYKELIWFDDDIIFNDIIKHIIESDNLELLFNIFLYLNNNYNISYDKPIEAMFIYFLKNKEKEFYPKFKKELVIWFNEFVFDLTPLGQFSHRNFFDIIIEYDVDLTADILQQSLQIDNDEIIPGSIIEYLFPYIRPFDNSIDNIKRKRLNQAFKKFSSKYSSSESISLLLTFSIVQNVNDPTKIVKQIEHKKFRNVVFLIFKQYLDPRFIEIDLKDRKKIVDFLLDQGLYLTFKLAILEAYISGQTSLTLQKDIFRLSDYIRKFYYYMTKEINQITIERSIKKEIKVLLLILVRLYDNNFDLDEWKTRRIINRYVFQEDFYSFEKSNNILYQQFAGLDLSNHEFNKTGILSNDYNKYDRIIKKDYFTFLVFQSIFNKLSKISESNDNELNEYVDLIHKLYSSLLIYTRNVTFINFAVEHKDKIAQARIEERNRIMANLSHTVKTMLSNVIDPLQNLKTSEEMKPVVIDNAIRGANLIRNLVNAMNLSFKGSIEDFIYDVQNNTYDNSSSMKEMFIDSLKQSISTTFDGKYFKKFVDNYYPTKAKYLEVKQKWNDISQFNDIDKIISFLDKYLVKTTLDISKAQEYVIGDDKGSALKLLILIQEIILNAVKYSSFVSKESRNLYIKFGANEKDISIIVSNTFKPNVQVKSSGLGQEIIRNFSKLLQTDPIININNNVYSVEIKFENIWRTRK